jgi:hypothetical protein
VLYDRIDSYPQNSDMPSHVRRALNYLRFKTAMITDDPNRVRRSAEACITRLCQDSVLKDYECIQELGTICGEIERRYPERAEEWSRPLVERIVECAGADIGGHMDKLLVSINANGWFTYGGLLLDEVRRRGLVDANTMNTLAIRLRATRLAKTQEAADPCESPVSVTRYLEHIDDAPLKGTLDMTDLRDILEEGLSKVYGGPTSGGMCNVVEGVLRSIRLIAGEGSFRGDRAELIESIDRFSRVYIVVRKATEPIDTVLATFLALSFCDTSTPEDHRTLVAQFHKCSSKLRSSVNDVLERRELGLLVTPEDVRGILGVYEAIFVKYVDDPLWPAFKFPWTSNEEIRLAARIELRFMQLESELDAFSLKVKYGGANPKLKQEVIYAISRAAQQLLPEAAFLRSPRYPGVSCQYRGGGDGFTAMIKGLLYEDGNKPVEKFRVMKYFHVGHRLEGVRERRGVLTNHREGLAPEREMQ